MLNWKLWKTKQKRNKQPKFSIVQLKLAVLGCTQDCQIPKSGFWRTAPVGILRSLMGEIKCFSGVRELTVTSLEKYNERKEERVWVEKRVLPFLYPI